MEPLSKLFAQVLHFIYFSCNIAFCDKRPTLHYHF